jgi:hypothetical protein
MPKERTMNREEHRRRRASGQAGRRERPSSKEGRHWPRAEADLEIAPRRINENNTTAALAYDRNQAEFARKADVAGKAREAKAAVEGPEGEDLRKAEETGKARSKGEDAKAQPRPGKGPVRRS